MNWTAKRTVLVPIDFSDESIRAVDESLQMVVEPSQIHVVHVLPMLAATEPGLVWDNVNDETRRDHVEREMRDRFADQKYKGLQFAVAFGDPGSEIAAHAERIGAELIALPSHGRTGLKRLLIGSVAERVCRLAHCAVLVLKR